MFCSAAHGMGTMDIYSSPESLLQPPEATGVAKDTSTAWRRVLVASAFITLAFLENDKSPLPKAATLLSQRPPLSLGNPHGFF